MRKTGFTLLELIVATAIFGMVVAAAYALFESSRSVSTRAEARAQLFQTARSALRAVEEDVRGAVMSGSAFDTGLLGTNGGTSDEPSDTLELVAVNAHVARFDEESEGLVLTESPRRRIDLSKVSYWVETGTTSTKKGLCRERQEILTPVTVYERRDENVEEVAADVASLDLRYYDEDWKESWDSQERRKLPKAVEVTVQVRGEWRGEEILERFASRFYLPVGAETPERTE